MLRVWLIARREYLERIRTRGFVISTILIPLVMCGLIFATIFLNAKTDTDRHIAVVSADTELVLDLQTELERQHPQPAVSSTGTPAPAAIPRKTHLFVDAMNPGPQNGDQVRAELNQRLESGDLDGYLWITPPASTGTRPAFEFTAKSSGGSLRNTVSQALGKVLLREQLHHRGIVATETDAMLEPVQIAAVALPHHADRASAEVSVSILFFTMYMVIMLYGMNVARSIIEEKTSRIFEVLLATVRPEAMMAGKISGVGAVGLTQVGIWLAAAGAIAGASSVLHPGGDVIHLTLTAAQVFFFLTYFILGYLFYSGIAAALGAISNSEQELQQLNMFLVLPLLICSVMLMPLLNAPDSTLARVLALVPPFTPLIMYMRVSLGHPAPWEVAVSLVLLTASIYGVILITSRIYRVGVLMYGKRPSLPEILRWLKYS